MAETGKSMAQASRDSGLSQWAISKMLSKPHQSQTQATVRKLAKGLETSPEWLSYGDTQDRDDHLNEDSDGVVVSLSLLRKVIDFVLRHEGVDPQRATILAEILPEALAGSLVDAVDRDPFRSFQVHFQLGAQRYDRRSHG